MPEPIKNLARKAWPGRFALPQPPLSCSPELAGYTWTFELLIGSIKMQTATDVATAFVTPIRLSAGDFRWSARGSLEGETPFGTAETLDECIRAAEAYVARRLAG